MFQLTLVLGRTVVIVGFCPLPLTSWFLIYCFSVCYVYYAGRILCSPDTTGRVERWKGVDAYQLWRASLDRWPRRLSAWDLRPWDHGWKGEVIRDEGWISDPLGSPFFWSYLSWDHSLRILSLFRESFLDDVTIYLDSTRSSMTSTNG